MSSSPSFSSQLRIDKPIQFTAIQDAFDVRCFNVGAVVLHPPIVQHIAADLVAPGDGAFFAVEGFELIVALGLLDLLQAAGEKSDRQAAVLLLAAFHRAGDLNAGGDVGDADGGRDLVDVLAAGAAGAHEGDDLHVGFGDFQGGVGVFEIGHHIDRGEAGLPFALGIEGAGANQAVHAGLGAHVAVGVFAFHQQGDVFDSRLLAPGSVDFRDIPAAPLEEIEIHAEEHFRPVLGFGAAGPGMDLDEAAFGVVLAVEQRLQLDFFRAFFQVGQGSVGLFHGVGVAGLFTELVHRFAHRRYRASIPSMGSMPALRILTSATTPWPVSWLFQNPSSPIFCFELFAAG